MSYHLILYQILHTCVPFSFVSNLLEQIFTWLQSKRGVQSQSTARFFATLSSCNSGTIQMARLEREPKVWSSIAAGSSNHTQGLTEWSNWRSQKIRLSFACWPSFNINWIFNVGIDGNSLEYPFQLTTNFLQSHSMMIYEQTHNMRNSDHSRRTKTRQ